MSLAAGAKLGPYEIVALLGSGGMGEVCRARDPRLGRDVAIKVLPAAFSTDPDRLHRFEQEARAAAALNHPNILAVYDIGQHNGSPFVVSELLEGETLRERLQGAPAATRSAGASAFDQSELPVRKAVEYAVQIAHGLAAAHEKGITHRDLKPENLFVTTDGRVKILDFGLAKLTQPEPALAGASALPTLPPATEPGLVLGTVGYMAPEQVRGLSVDYRADIFAFGAILYEMLSGRRAFRGETTADTMTAILKEDPPDLPVVDRHIPPALERIVDRCLEKSPTGRFQSTMDLAFALEALSAHSGATQAVSGVPAPGKRDRLAWALVVVLALALALTAAVALRSRGAAAIDGVVRLSIDAPETVALFGSMPAVSPNGRLVAFTATTVEGKTLLWVRPLDSLAARSLPGTDGAAFPFWSPDNRSLGFAAGGKLKKIDVSGGFPETLCDVGGDPRGATWNRDGVIVFSTGVGPLSRVSAAGGSPTRATALDQTRRENSHRWPQFLPDGRHFLFTVRSERPEYHGIYVASLDSNERKRLVSALSNAAYAPPGLLLFFRDGDLLAQKFDVARLEVEGEPTQIVQQVQYLLGSANAAFSISETGLLAYMSANDRPTRQLIWADRGGRQLATGGQGGYPAISPDGGRIALDRIDPQTGTADIWLIDASRGVDTPLTRHPAYDQNPVWSPDGTRIVFDSSREGPAKLYEKPVSSGVAEERLLDSTTFNRPMDWTSDGRFIVYMNRDPRTNMDLWALPLFGDRKPFPIARSEFAESQGHVSPDGRWIAYSSDESGRSEIYVQAFPAGGRTWRISSGGGSAPRWRRNGTELFYIASDRKLMSAPVAAAGVPEFGAPIVLFDAKFSDTLRDGNPYDVSPDGQRFLLPAGTDAPPPITVVLNWTAGLKK